MSELFLEIQEEMKRERIEKIWRKVGRFAVWGSVAVVVATAVFVTWEDYSRRQAEEKTSGLLQGVERLNVNDYKGAISFFSALSDDNTSVYYPLAMLRKAQAQELSGDVEGAKKTYSSLAKNESEFMALAKLKNTEKGYTVDVPKSSPFYYSIAEHNAWQLLGAGKKAEAVNIFASLHDDKKAPESLVSRVGEVLRVIAPEKSEKKVVNE